MPANLKKEVQPCSASTLQQKRHHSPWPALCSASRWRPPSSPLSLSA